MDQRCVATVVLDDLYVRVFKRDVHVFSKRPLEKDTLARRGSSSVIYKYDVYSRDYNPSIRGRYLIGGSTNMNARD